MSALERTKDFVKIENEHVNALIQSWEDLAKSNSAPGKRGCVNYLGIASFLFFTSQKSEGEADLEYGWPTDVTEEDSCRCNKKRGAPSHLLQRQMKALLQVQVLLSSRNMRCFGFESLTFLILYRHPSRVTASYNRCKRAQKSNAHTAAPGA